MIILLGRSSNYEAASLQQTSYKLLRFQIEGLGAIKRLTSSPEKYRIKIFDFLSTSLAFNQILNGTLEMHDSEAQYINSALPRNHARESVIRTHETATTGIDQNWRSSGQYSFIFA
jgi:hypothetical protein